MIGKIRVVSAGDGWCVELPRFGFVPQPGVRFPTHAEALAFAVAEADRRGASVSLYAGVGEESRALWTLRAERL